MARNKIYQVFVSSTYEDLKEERLAVMNALIEKHCLPVVMEKFPACNMKQIDYIKRLIDEVDYYVLIIAGKYGSIEKSSNKSYTQLEYEYAKSKNVPIASFVIQNTDVLNSIKVEKTTKRIKQLERFKQVVMADKMCKTWTNKDELARHVLNAIDELVESSPREGWIRPSKIPHQNDDKVFDGLELDKEIALTPFLSPFSLYDETDLVKKTTWRQVFTVIGPYLKNPIRRVDYEELLRKYYIGISQKDIDSLTEQLICLGFLLKKNEGTYKLVILSFCHYLRRVGHYMARLKAICKRQFLVLNNNKDAMLPLVQNDPWLNPVSKAVDDRHNRYEQRLNNIKNNYGSLKTFATAHQFLGFNYDKRRHGWWYREWAPAAHYLSLMGDFNNWNRYEYPLELAGAGLWEIFLPDSKFGKRLVHGSKLKVLVQSQIGEHERIPVYIKRVIQDEGNKDFAGQFWNPPTPYIFKHAAPKLKNEPLLIYETHVGMAQEEERVGTYKEFTDKILPRIKADGYNAIQLMAIAEHPYYGSFGYHVSNFFAPSSRFGTPEELKELIDTAHGMGMLVIMDLVHSHTVKNIREGINLFDGSDSQYLHPGERGNHNLWDSKLFNYGKEETLQFLLSNVRYWLEDFRFDGFRFDGVTSMLYLDHGIGTTFDAPEKYFGDNVDADAVTYMQLANTLCHELNPQAVTIAEDVSGMPGLCNPIADGGMGFDYRLGMGLPDFWIKVLKDEPEEQWNMKNFFFTMTNHLPQTKTVAYAESHDQALVGDKTIAFRLMDKEMYTAMSVDTPSMTVDRGIALHKMIRLFTLTLGGEAWLNFMGNEFGHPEWIDFPRLDNGWSYQYARRQWSLVDNPNLKYHFMGAFDKAMLEFVKHHPVMQAPPAWMLYADEENKTVVYERGNLIFVFNWGPNSVADYKIPVRQTGDYRIILTSDDKAFGGFGNIDASVKFPSEKKGDTITMKVYNVSRVATVYQRV